MSGREQGGGTLVILAAFVVVAVVLAYALWPHIQVVLEQLQRVAR